MYKEWRELSYYEQKPYLEIASSLLSSVTDDGLIIDDIAEKLYEYYEEGRLQGYEDVENGSV